MKRKKVGIFVFMLLVFTAVSTTVNSEDNNTDNQIFFNGTETYENCGCYETNKFMFGNGLTKEVSLIQESNEIFSKPIAIDTPDYFNWMDFEGQDWTTSAKSQSFCGSCAIFSALGALESIINIEEGKSDLNLDLSEQYVLSCLPRAGNCNGGSSYNTFYYIKSNRFTGNNCNGIIPEFCFPYRAIDFDGFNGLNHENDPVYCNEKCADWENYLIPISDCGKWFPDGSLEDRNAIKTQVMQNGPVATSLQSTWYIHGEDNLVDWGFIDRDPNDYYSSQQTYNTINHNVVIVGWKDDPEIPNGGYWICKNSWSTDWGYNGFFNIEYGCLRIDDSEIDWVVYDPDVLVNWRPIGDAGGIYYGDVGQEIMFDASGSFDHEGEIISYVWDFGDGNQGFGMNTIHSYDTQAVYSVKLYVEDNQGNIVNDTTWAFIGRSNDPPNKPNIDGPTYGKRGVEHEYKFSTTDPDGDDIYYYVFWGDIYPEWIGPFPSGEIITLSHTWIDKAKYHLRVKTKDCYGFHSEWASLNVSIPKGKPKDLNLNFIDWFFERFPNAFPILKKILILTLEKNFEKLILQEV